jgi:acetylglutamate kinase
MSNIIPNADRAAILGQSLPYIRRLSGKTVVIKYGGAAMASPQLQSAVMGDIVLLALIGVNIVLVHGGGPEINAVLKKTGKESRFVNGLRYTDDETMEVVQMVLCGKVNKDLTRKLCDEGGKALGLCGLDGLMLKAVRRTQDGNIGQVGDIVEVDPALIFTAQNNGYIPVVSTVAAGENGEVLNINADTAAAHIAAATGALKLILMTDTKGLLRNPEDESTLISRVELSHMRELEKSGIISGGMLPKVACCVEAVRRGVESSHIIDGRIPHSILIELLTDEGIGTMIA